MRFPYFPQGSHKVFRAPSGWVFIWSTRNSILRPAGLSWGPCSCGEFDLTHCCLLLSMFLFLFMPLFGSGAVWHLVLPAESHRDVLGAERLDPPAASSVA